MVEYLSWKYEDLSLFLRIVFLRVLLMSIFMEEGILLVTNYYEGLHMVLDFNSLGGWVVYDGDGLRLKSEGGVGIAALYSCSA